MSQRSRYLRRQMERRRQAAKERVALADLIARMTWMLPPDAMSQWCAERARERVSLDDRPL